MKPMYHVGNGGWKPPENSSTSNLFVFGICRFAMSFSASRRRTSPDLEKFVSSDNEDEWLAENISPFERVTVPHVSQNSSKTNNRKRRSSARSVDVTATRQKRLGSLWLRSSHTKTSCNDDDTDAGKAQTLQKRRVELLHTILDLSEEMTSHWPGSNAYLQYIEGQVQELWCEFTPAAFSVLGYPARFEVSHGLQFLAVVAGLFKDDQKDGISISELCDSVMTQYNVDPDSEEISKEIIHSGEQAIFAAIGWLSMLYKPAKATARSFNLNLEPKQASLKPLHMRDVAKRPVAGFLRGLGNILPSPDPKCGGFGGGAIPGASNDGRSQQIYTSTLNYYSLRTIGNINIKWVDTLSAHLEFHTFSRTLMLFRFPSFCALNCLDPEQLHCFDQILKDYYKHHASWRTHDILTAYKREVLLSYRLIFGQQRRSRNEYTSMRTKRASGADRLHDPLLDRLCGAKIAELRSLPSDLWLDSCLDSNEKLLEQDVYSSDVHFPLLGDRLLSLQEFNLRQSPSRIRDLWRDRRNPLQWYTLWAVLIIGGLSLLLQIVQVLLSTAQFGFQLRQT